MSCSNLNSSQKLLTVSWFLFLSSSIGLAALGYQCFQKFLERPQTLDISIHPQHELDLPVFTFCPVGSYGRYPPPLNLTNLHNCGLTMSDMVLDGTIVGSGSPECEDPEKFWDSITLNLGDFGIQGIYIIYVDATMEMIHLDQNDPIWTKHINFDFNGESHVYETCFSLKLPKKSKNLNQLNINMDPNVSLFAFVHHFGFLNPVYKTTSLQYGQTYLQSSGTHVEVKYSQIVGLEDNAGKPCISDQSFSLTSLYLNKTEEVYTIYYWI